MDTRSPTAAACSARTTAGELAAGELRPAGRGPHAYYSRMGVIAGQRRRGVLPRRRPGRRRWMAGAPLIDPPDAQVPGGDNHDIWIDPTNGDRMAVGNDGGIRITDESRPHLEAGAAPDRADVPRDGGQPAFPTTSMATARTAPRLAGRATAAAAGGDEVAPPSAQHVAHRGRRRERLRHARSRWTPTSSGRGVRLRQRRRHRHALRQQDRRGAARGGLAGTDDRIARAPI